MFSSHLMRCIQRHGVCIHRTVTENNKTGLLTPWSTVFLEKLTDPQLVKKFPAFYETRRSITQRRKYSKMEKGQRISWLGHLERMEEDKMPKKIFDQELEGTRRRRIPRKGWKEEEERDLQVLGVRRWRELVADRRKWKDIVRQAKAHNRL